MFVEEVFPLIAEEPFRALYCENNGKPNTPINVMVGASIIKELQYYSDDDIVEGLQLLADADTLSVFCSGRFKDWKEYQLFSRCISEQTVKEEGDRRLAIHEDGTMNSSILQNPSDPEATFRSKAGEEHRGYVANLEETVGENGSVIIDYQFEQNTYNDSQFLEDVLTAMESSEEPVTIATGGAYPTPGNQELAEEKMSISFQ